MKQVSHRESTNNTRHRAKVGCSKTWLSGFMHLWNNQKTF